MWIPEETGLPHAAATEPAPDPTLAGRAANTLTTGIRWPFRVTVKDAAGEPVAGVTLRTRSEEALPQCAGTSRDGSAEFVALQDSVVVGVDAGSEWVRPRGVVVERREPAGVVTLDRGHVIRGRVCDENGDAVADASIIVRRIPRTRW